MKLRTLITTAIAVLALTAPVAQANTLSPEGTTTPGIGRAVPSTPAAAPKSGGFDWGYTALGAAAMLLIVVATVGSIRLTGLTKNAQQALRTS
jgi:hypothetical protein